jgi:hypothetical protein
VRIEVDPGGLQTPGFDSINQEISATVAGVTGGLESASGAAGTPSLAAAISDLADVLSTADSSAALSLSGLAAAVVRAGQRYAANEAAISRAEIPR